MENYNALCRFLPQHLQPNLTYNRRVEETHDKLDLVYVDKFYALRDTKNAQLQGINKDQPAQGKIKGAAQRTGSRVSKKDNMFMQIDDPREYYRTLSKRIIIL